MGEFNNKLYYSVTYITLVTSDRHITEFSTNDIHPSSKAKGYEAVMLCIENDGY